MGAWLTLLTRMCRGWLVVGVAADSRCWFDQTCQRPWMFLETTNAGCRDDNVRPCKWDLLSSLIPDRVFTYRYSPVQQSFAAQAIPNCLYIHRIQFPAPQQQNPKTNKKCVCSGQEIPQSTLREQSSSFQQGTSDLRRDGGNPYQAKNFKGSKSTEKHILGQTVLFYGFLL